MKLFTSILLLVCILRCIWLAGRASSYIWWWFCTFLLYEQNNEYLLVRSQWVHVWKSYSAALYLYLGPHFLKSTDISDNHIWYIYIYMKAFWSHLKYFIFSDEGILLHYDLYYYFVSRIWYFCRFGLAKAPYSCPNQWILHHTKLFTLLLLLSCYM